ncbi:hypothetical protein JM80_0615 [Cellulophaga sp. RHA_52]|uniref:hypothetical protein n=1 Tax=Cellulophaga sp. RHA_52 TaxID=1250036 RepID=UPI00119B26C8|nr:hypothetical protein [Cellulophaga sp. RHA_52]TVZ08131.1 hypothetical protein JM80_0615 [Cellulophaga sp. RHA_52]
MELHKDDIPTLDFMLDLLIKRDSHIFEQDLKNFGKYKNEKESYIYSEFKRLIFFFDHFSCGNPRNDRGLSQWIDINSYSSQFKHSGGFKNAYENLEKESEDKRFEKELKRLQKEKLEYEVQIRDKNTEIRSLKRDNLRLKNWDIRFRWYIAIVTFVVGFIVKHFISK